MPNFDGGHYFLTALAPVKTGHAANDDDMSRPHVRVLRDVLACLPTAPAGEATFGIDSPFARNGRTHRARFVVIDDVALGRDGPAMPREADRLSAPFLLFAADFDATGGDDAELERYLAELWDTMAAELVAVFQHCVGFEDVGDAGDAGAFSAYIERCQVETTMPVNDYWTARAPAAPTPARDMAILPRLAPAGLAACGTLLALLFRAVPAGPWPWGWLALGGAGLTAALLWTAYAAVTRAGGQALPAAPGSDLPSIRKALYLRRAFAAFTDAARDRDAKTLYRDFGAFLAKHKPRDPGATQAPGVIGS